MMSTLDLLIFLDSLGDRPPAKEDFEELDHHDGETYIVSFDENGYNETLYQWEQETNQRHQNLADGYEHGHIRESPEETILQALADSTAKIEQAEKHRSELLALAIHSIGVSVRAAAEASGLHAKTAEKRANESTSLATVIAYKERELEALRKQVSESGK